jgi:putrescine importer
MGRDGILPKHIFAYLHPLFATPSRSTLLMGLLSFAGAMATTFQLVVELVNFGAFVGFILVNLSVVAHYFIRQKQRSGVNLLWYGLCPLLGAVVCCWVWLSLSVTARITGFAWLAAGTVYLAATTRGFRQSVRSVELP